MTGRALPRWSLAVLCAFVAAMLGYGASVLPWRTWTSFGIATAIVAAMHGVTAILCLAGSAQRRVAWRAQSLAACVYLAWLGFSVTGSAVYLAELYGGLGQGVASVLFAFGTVAAALLVPPALWCLAVTGVRVGRRGAIAGALGVVLFAGGVWRVAASARSDVLVGEDPSTLADAIAGALPAAVTGPSAMTRAPAVCAEPPGEGVTTIVAAFATADGAAIECVQEAAVAPAVARLEAMLADRARGRIAIDVVTARHELASVDPVADLFTLRPGLDGVCEGTRCLMPWQLVALQSFAAVAPVDVLHEVGVGFDPAAVREALGVSASASIDGLVRIETASFTTDARGELVPLHRLRRADTAFDRASLRASVRAAEDYIASAQLPDGRFEYSLDPFGGELSMAGFSVARQAGTTLVMCELAEDRSRAVAIADASLRMLAESARRHDDLLVLHDPGEAPPAVDLGDSALGAIAFLSCRPLVGDRFDAQIDGLTRFLLAMRRDDGSFHPQFDLARGEIVRGPDPLFAVGQGVLALVLLEQLVAEAPGRFAAADEIHAAVEAAMDYVATDYASRLPSDFLYIEENWHCLAARAALPVHRHDGYEQFCLDYVRWKTRLVQGDSDGVDADLVGGYGFGNLVLPWAAGSATFGEAAAGALAVIDARGLPREPIESRLRLALAFLVHHQWKDAECFACSASHPIAGAWSEHPGSGTIRIDFVQHAMGALGHGGRMLGWIQTPA